MAVPNHYETLGVPPSADGATLRAAYLAKAREVHPDRHVSDPAASQAKAARAMQQVNEAWAVLGNPTLRSRYDTDVAYLARRSATGPTNTYQAGARPLRRSTPSTASRAGATAAPRGAGYAQPIPPDPNRGVPHVESGVGVRVVKVLSMLILVGVLVGVAVYFVATSISSKVSGPSSGRDPTEIDALWQVGECVEITSALIKVDCSRPNDGVVSAIIEIDQLCPEGTGQIPIDPARAACVRPR